MRFVRIVFVLVVLAAAGASAFLYFLHSADQREGASLAGNADAVGPSSAALGQFTPLDPPRPAPELSFAARDGSPARLTDFRGRWVLINLWATWCAPCVREMPSLDRLQAKLGERLTVLAISQDRGAEHVVDPFLERLGLSSLHIYLDAKGTIGRELGARGLPTTFLVDSEGRLRARLEGAADWDSPAMFATLTRYLGGADAAGATRGAPGRG